MVAAGLHTPEPAKKMPRLPCDWCGDPFPRSPADRSPKHNFCTRTCMAAWQSANVHGERHPRWTPSILKICDACGACVTRKAWHAKQSRELAFCNRACFGEWKKVRFAGDGNPAWRGGKEYYYGPNWTRQAQRARRRDGQKCKLCGIASDEHWRALDVHHIRPFRLFGLLNFRKANRLLNLVTLCNSCHARAEKISACGTITTWAQLAQHLADGKP